MRVKKLNRNVIRLGLVSLFNDISSQMIYPLLPVFLSSVLGLGTVFIGLLEGIAESASSLLRVFSGWYSDRLKKRKPLILWGYSLSTIGRPFLYLATRGWQVLLIRFLDRVGKGIRTSPRDALVADSSLAAQRGKAFGVQRALDRMGAFLGPLVAFILLPILDNNLRMLFLLAVIPGFVAVLIVLFVVKEKTSTSSPPSSRPLTFTLRGFNRDFKMFVVILAVFTLGNSSNAFLILRARDLGVKTGLIPVFWLMYNFISSVSAAPLGILSDRIGRRKTTLLGFLVYGVVYLGFAFSGTRTSIWFFMGLYGIYYGLSGGVLRAYVADLVEDKSVLATAYGLYHTVVGLCIFPASLIMGILWHQFSPTLAFAFGAALAFLSAMGLSLLVKK